MSHQDLDVAARVRAHGHRLTPQRQIILDALCDAGGHATPDDVYARVRDRSTAINRTTVYRTLSFLCDTGLVTSTTSASGHLEYEIAGQRPHHHLVCQQCGAATEMPHEPVGPLWERIRDEYGFAVSHGTHLTLFGLCAQCRSKATEE